MEVSGTFFFKFLTFFLKRVFVVLLKTYKIQQIKTIIGFKYFENL